MGPHGAGSVPLRTEATSPTAGGIRPGDAAFTFRDGPCNPVAGTMGVAGQGRLEFLPLTVDYVIDTVIQL